MVPPVGYEVNEITFCFELLLFLSDKKSPVGKFKGRKEDFKIMTIISQVKCQEIRMDA
jgi:hypothetical protein